MNNPNPNELSLIQEVVNKQRWWEDLVRTGKIGLLIVPALALAEHYLPEAPWPLIKELAFAVAAVFGISIISAASTKKKHAEIVKNINAQKPYLRK